MSDRPEFGPSGYLPERAAKRARKIVLRAELGLQWVIGALVAGALVLVAGIVYLQSRDAPPPEPWIAVGDVSELGPSRELGHLDVLLVAATGRPRAFTGATGISYCEATNRLESADGGVWTLTGRGLAGTPSLTEHPTLLRSGTLYIDPTRSHPAPEAMIDPAPPGCS